MSETIKAWVYSRIDAPEDSHGSLKHQDQQLAGAEAERFVYHKWEGSNTSIRMYCVSS